MKSETIREILLDSFRRLKVLARKRIHAIATQTHHEPATFERELRRMVDERLLTKLNWEGKEAVGDDHIVAWRYSSNIKTTSVWKKKKQKSLAVSLTR